MNIAILTPILVEHNAVLAQLPCTTEHFLDGNRYLTGAFDGKFHRFNVITHQSGSKNENTALAAERVIRLFSPMVVILAGVAGGVKDVEIGDLVIGTKYYGYEFGKVTPDGFATRPESGQYSKELLTLAQSVAGNGHWRKRAKNTADSRVVFGAIAAGNKVIAATDSDAYRLLKQTFNDTTAIEMEAIGFGQAMQSYPTVRYLNVRGISDLLDGKSKSDAGGSQELAAANMAAFVFELLYQLDVSQYKVIGNMDIKELSKEIIDLVASQGMPANVNSPINSLLQAIQPFIANELKALHATPNDADAKAEAKSELRRVLADDDALARQLKQLVEQVKLRIPNSTVNIRDSKNVINGSHITVGGDFRIGDN